MASTVYCCALTFCFLLFNAYAHHEIVFTCITPNAEFGECISIFFCLSLMKSLGTLHPRAIQFVRDSICCESAPYDLKVCCGYRGNYLRFEEITQAAPTLPSITSPPQESATQQTSPLPLSPPLPTDNAIEVNTEMLYTSALLSTSTLPSRTSPPQESATQQTRPLPLSPPLPTDNAIEVNTEILYTSALLSTSTTAASKVESRITQQQQEHRKYAKKKLLPSLKFCGLQHTDDRFYTGNITALDEFPWLVHVIFLPDEDEDPLQYLDRCNGVLLNNRYVLTIGVCANLAPAVRLGQHNVNKTISCILDPRLPECNEPRYDISVVEEIHRSPDIAAHDFALLRLAQKVQYSDYVRPICLPFPEYKRPKEVSQLIFSGWGAVDQEVAAIKKRLTYNLTDNIEECLRLDDTNLKQFTANNSVMCLVPDEENTELACTGDIGGSLMFSHRHQWFAEGLLTGVYDWYQEGKVTGVYDNSTVDDCSDKLPVSGIRITSEILDWIMDNIKA